MDRVAAALWVVFGLVILCGLAFITPGGITAPSPYCGVYAWMMVEIYFRLVTISRNFDE